MKYRLLTTDAFDRRFKKLDPSVQKTIKRWIETHLLDETRDPRDSGKPLTGNYKGYWRYRIGDYRLLCEIRIGDYRLLCEIRDEELVIVALDVGHPSNIYHK